MQKKIFVVSCQALKDEPLFGKDIMTKMAHAALLGGADWIRTSQLHNIKSMLADEKINVPIIGLVKKKYIGSNVFITPTLNELQALIKTGVDVIAIDATQNKRPKESLVELFDYFQSNKKINQKIMADCSTIKDIKLANKLGFDYISTTLVGYTGGTKGKYTPHNDFKIIKMAKKIVKVPLVAEGGINTPEQAQQAFAHGADIVVVGSHITRPRFITKKFVKAIQK